MAEHLLTASAAGEGGFSFGIVQAWERLNELVAKYLENSQPVDSE